MQHIRNNLVCFPRANICGVEFTADQRLDGDRFGRCGSLITCVVNGQSMYGRVIKFFQLLCCQGDPNNSLFAYIEWLCVPEYPMGDTPLVVRVSDNGPVCLASSVVSIFDIDPSRIIIERCDDEFAHYVCRIEGLDVVKIINV